MQVRSHPPTLLPFLTSLALLFCIGASASIFTSTSKPINLINTRTDYSIIILDDNSFGIAGTIRLTFQSPIAFSNNSDITSCYDPNSPTTVYHCQAINSSTIIIPWDSPNSNINQINPLITINNPPYVDNFTVTYQFIKPDGTVFASAVGSIKNLVADTLTSCSLSFSPTTTNTGSTVTIDITTKNYIPIGGTLSLTVSYPITATTLTFNSLTNATVLNSSVVPINAGNGMYVFSRLFIGSIAANSHLRFTIASVTTPSTTSTTSFSMYITTSYTSSYSNIIDTKTCAVTGITDSPIVSLSFPITNFMVGESGKILKMDLITPATFLLPSDTISIATDATSAQHISITSSYSTIVTNYSVWNQMSCQNSANGVITKISTDGSNLSITASTAVQFFTGMFIKSLTNSGSKNIFVQFFRNGFSYASATSTVTITPNLLLSAGFTSTSATVSTFTSYTFSITLRNGVAAGAAVRITLPAEMYIAPGNCTASVSGSPGGSINTVTPCFASSSTVLMVSGITNTNFVGTSTMAITISNIQNPITTKTTNAIFIQTFYSSAQLTNPVDNTNSNSFSLNVTASAYTIANGDFSISRNNTSNLKYAIATVSYKVNTKFKANGYITITFPNPVSLSVSNSSTFTLTYSNGSSTTSQTVSVTESIGVSTNTITFNFSNKITSDLTAGTVFTIIVNSLLNYYSFKPITPILKSYSTDGYGVQQSSNSFSMSNTIQDTSLTVLSTTTNRMNGLASTYTFQITSPYSLPGGSLIALQLQNTGNSNTQVYLSSTVTCMINSLSVACIPDSTNPRLLKITTGAAIASSTAFTVAVSSLILSRSFQQPGLMYFRLFEMSGTTPYNYTSAIFTPPLNILTNAVKTVALNIIDNGGASPSKLNQLQTFTLTITTTNRFQSGDIVVVTIPAQYLYILGTTVTVSNITGNLCPSTSNIFCYHNNSSPNLIRIVQTTAGLVFNNISSFSVTIKNGTYRSPQLWSNFNANIFLVNTYSSLGQPVDAVQSGTTANATFYLACPSTTLHCKTCIATTCQSCYQLGDGYDTSFAYGAYYYKASTGQCVQACGANYYNSSNQCRICNSPCYSCENNADFCTSCLTNTSTVLYLFNGTCSGSCLSGYYADASKVCQKCSNSCLTCNSSPSNCTSCTGSYYINSSSTGTCVGALSCPAGTFADNSTFSCAACSASCNSVGCNTNATMCSGGCATNYWFHQLYNPTNVFPGQCANTCFNGKVIDTANVLGGGCKCNFTACAACTITVNQCSSCVSGKLLYNYTCLTSCLVGFYSDGSTCQLCPTNCTSCNNASYCTACLSPNALSSNACVATCPSDSTRRQIGSQFVCVPCSLGCTQCTTSTYCTICLSSLLYQSPDSTNRYCVSSCSTGFYNYLQQSCVTSCPGGYSISGGACQANAQNNTNTNSLSTSLSTSSSRIVPFPVTIAFAVLAVATFASKIALPFTIIPAALAAFAGGIQIIGWIIFMIAAGTNSDPNYPLSTTGLYIVLIGLILNWFLNGVNLYFLKKYIWDDQKFQSNLKRLRSKTKAGMCVVYTCLVTSAVLSHKFIQILFSNLFEASYFIFKVDDKVKLTPLNYIRYFSLIPSVLAIIGAAMANYQNQTLSTSSLVFMQSIDLIIVTLLASIIGLWCTMRKGDEYQNNIAEKKNDLESQLEHDVIQEDENQFEQQAKNQSTLSKYIHSSSIRQADPKNDPLARKITKKNVFGEQQNRTTDPIINEHDSIDQRINLNFMKESVNNKQRINGSNIDIDQIELIQESGQQLLPSKVPKKDSKKVGNSLADRHNTNKNKGSQNRYSKNEDEIQKQKLKDNIQNKLTAEQIEKTRVVKNVDQIDTSSLKLDENLGGSENNLKQKTKNQLKKDKLQSISNSNQQDLKKLSRQDQEKAGDIKNAMNLLKARKVKIQEYLDYLDTIEEENQDANSDDYQNHKKGQGNGKKIGNKPKKSKLQESLRKNKTARKKIDQTLIINTAFDEDDGQFEPEPANFHVTPVKARNATEAGNLSNDDDDFNRLSGMKKNANNRSDQMFMKNKSALNDDLVMISLQSGDNYDKSLGDQFQKGNTLQQVDKDELPPSNLYSTQRMTIDGKRGAINNSVPINKDRIIPNTLMGDDDHIDFIESQGGDQQTIKGDMVQFNNDISPSHFNEPNMRMENDQISQAPTKPKVNKKMKAGQGQGSGNQDGIGRNQNIKDRVLEVQDIEDEEFDPNYDEFNRQYEGEMPHGSKMNRYQSNRMLDYDQILYNDKQNEKMKKLQEIYLPRIDVHKTKQRKKKRKNYSSQSFRKQQQK